MNPELAEKFEDAGMHFVGEDEVGERKEILELASEFLNRGTRTMNLI